MSHSRIAAAALLSVSALALSAPARAQAPVYNWTGFYIGGNVGAAWGSADASTNAPCTAATLGAGGPGYFCTVTNPVNGVAVSASGTGTAKDTGITGGVQAGFNLQRDRFIYGFEADFGAFNLNASRSVTAPYPANNIFISGGTPYTITNSADTYWLFTARGRFGWAFTPTWIWYATGGLALTKLDTNNTFRDSNPGNGVIGARGAWGASSTKVGWTVGTGFEWMVARHWTVKAEYLYVDFGKVTSSGIITHPGLPAKSQAINTSIDLTAHIARIGVNYKWD